MLRSPFGSAGLLRLRLPAELAVAHAYGSLVPDERSEHLYHLAGCDADTSVAFAFRFTKSDGWGSSSEVHASAHHGAGWGSSPEVHASAHHGAGWGSSPEVKPAVQLAYSYRLLVPALPERDEGEEGDSEADDDDGCHDRQIFVRRLRVQTIRLEVARSLRELYESIDSTAMLGLLTHKVICAIEHQGAREGRLLVQVRPWPLMPADDC